MSNIITKQYTKQGNVLFHPHFDRPTVKNPVIRGKKKGCISFAVVKRKLTSRSQLAAMTVKEREPTIQQKHQSLTDWGVAVMRTDYETAFHMASAALAKYKEMSNGLQASK